VLVTGVFFAVAPLGLGGGGADGRLFFHDFYHAIEIFMFMAKSR
jgi:hypothetical protein